MINRDKPWNLFFPKKNPTNPDSAAEARILLWLYFMLSHLHPRHWPAACNSENGFGLGCREVPVQRLRSDSSSHRFNVGTKGRLCIKIDSKERTLGQWVISCHGIIFLVRHMLINQYGNGSKPCSPGEHQNRWQTDVHPLTNCIYRYWSIAI